MGLKRIITAFSVLISAKIFINAEKTGVTYQEKDFEEFYTAPLNTTRYPNISDSYAMLFN
jgi:hypothetical protein